MLTGKSAIKSIKNQPLLQPMIEVPELTIINDPLESPNEMFSCLQTETENASTPSTYMEDNENVISTEPVEFILYPSQETNTTTSTKNDITEKLDSLTVTVNAIKNNLKELQETQQQLMLRTISMQAQFEEFLRKTQEENLHKEIGINPINSLDSLQELEDTLKDEICTTELIKKKSVVAVLVRAEV